MRCSASPTTCIAEPPHTPPAPPRAPDEAATAFATLLFRIAFRPLSQPLGFFGDVAIDACARALAHGVRIPEDGS